MAKRVGWSIDDELIHEIQSLCANKKAISDKASEILRIGLHYYKEGSRIKTEVVKSNSVKNESTSEKSKSPFLN